MDTSIIQITVIFTVEYFSTHRSQKKFLGMRIMTLHSERYNLCLLLGIVSIQEFDLSRPQNAEFTQSYVGICCLKQIERMARLPAVHTVSPQQGWTDK